MVCATAARDAISTLRPWHLLAAWATPPCANHPGFPAPLFTCEVLPIERSVFSQCIFELEDAILGEIDAHIKEAGWTVASLQFDGLHVEHREADIDLAMRAVEARVKRRLSYDIKLVEKPLCRAD